MRNEYIPSPSTFLSTIGYESQKKLIYFPFLRFCRCAKWRGGHDKLSNRDLLRMAIDAALEKQPKDFDVLLALLKSSGYSVARKSRLSLRHENQKQSIRLDSLGEGYSEQELRAVLAGGRTHKPFVRKKYPKRRERATLIADIAVSYTHLYQMSFFGWWIL